ncbi:MAG: hypothetical protein JWP25_8225 [Bradyrhizobium sp.]|nr:hypothetical protein [Bradyrhizobium sp.]
MATSNIWTSLDGGPFAHGLDIEQTSPVGGSYTGPVSFNTINVIDQGVSITSPGTDIDNFGLSNGNLVGLRVNYSSAGGDIRGAAIAAYRATGPTAGSYYGFTGSIYTNVPGGNQLLWGNIGVAQVGPAGSASLIIGTEGEVAVYGAGTVQQRIGVNANSQGPNQAGTALDAAYAVSAGGGTSSAAPFKKMFAVTKALLGTAPLDTAGDIFWSDTAMTIANVFNSSNWTVTGNFADFPNFGINGAGQASFGLPISTITANFGFQVGGSAKGLVGIGTSANTTTGANFVDVRNSTIAAEVVLLANEAARTTVRYGLTLGNYTEMSSFSGNGQIIGTNNSAPLMFGTNNVNRMQIASGGQVNVGPNVAATASFTINRNTVSPAPSGGSNTIFQTSGGDGAGSLALTDNYGGTFGVMEFRSARGTGAAFTASQSGDSFGLIGFLGAQAANTFAADSGGAGGAFIAASATENWSATNQGTQLKFFTTANGTAAIGLNMILKNTGMLSVNAATAIPAGGSQGAGLGLSSTANFGIFFGSGVPTLSAAQGSLYLRSDGSSTSTRMYVNTNGSTGWTNVTTAT